MLADKEVRELHESIYSVLKEAVNDGITEEKGELAGRLRADAFFYSGFKTFHEMKESAFLLTDEAGNLRPLREFQQAVAKIDDVYNKRWLETEYNQAVQSAAMAERWQQFEEGAERYDLQYRAVADERTRADHRALNGVTLPFSDPFWEAYYPPNGWNCRCTVVQVRKGKYERSVSSEAIAKGEAATSKPKQELFRTNTAKQKRLFPEHNAYTTSSCKGCSQLGEFTLAYNPGSELCRACVELRRNCEDKTKYIQESKAEYKRLLKNKSYLNVEFDERTGGVKATHKEHNFDPRKGHYEVNCQNAGFKSGNRVILEKEDHTIRNKRNTEGSWNGKTFEIKGCETGTITNICRGLKHAVAKNADIAVLYFEKPFEKELFEKAIIRYNGLRGDPKQWKLFDSIICVVEDKIVYKKSHH